MRERPGESSAVDDEYEITLVGKISLCPRAHSATVPGPARKRIEPGGKGTLRGRAGSAERKRPGNEKYLRVETRSTCSFGAD